MSRLTVPAPVVGIEADLQRMPEAVNRYREIVADLGNAPIDIERTRESSVACSGIFRFRRGTAI